MDKQQLETALMQLNEEIALRSKTLSDAAAMTESSTDKTHSAYLSGQSEALKWCLESLLQKLQ